MSFELSFKASKCTLGSSSTKAVLRCLCDHADNDGTHCHPSIDSIAKETECNRKTVFKAISFLVSHCWIRLLKTTRGTRNNYEINIQKIESEHEQFKLLNGRAKPNAQNESSFLQRSSNFYTGYKSGTSIINGTRLIDGSPKDNTTYCFETDSKNGLTAVPNSAPNSVKEETLLREKREHSRDSIPCPFEPDSKIPNEFKKFAEDKAVPDPQDEFEKFVDWYRSRNKHLADWTMGWRNWVRRSVEYRRISIQRETQKKQHSNSFTFEPECGFTESYYKNDID